MEAKNSLIASARAFVEELFAKELPADYVYHDLQHTLDTAERTQEIGHGMGLSSEELEIVEIAGIFHDAGYTRVYHGHEEESINIARQFLEEQGADAELIEKVRGCIAATKMPQNPQNLLEEVMCDADMYSLGNDDFFQRNEQLRQEWKSALNEDYSEEEWHKENITFASKHRYFTAYGQQELGPGQDRNLTRMQQLVSDDFQPEGNEDGPQLGENLPAQASETKPKKKKKKKKDKVVVDLDALSPEELDKTIKRRLKEKIPERGIETMFRTTSRNHIQLSAIADNKANIMLSINAIIISIIVSSLVPRLEDQTHLAIPTMILLATCIASVIYATLSTRPKVTEGKFTRADIENKRANLLFFGNFHSVDLKDFEWGMSEVMSDRDYLYSSMMRDLYFLGRVLHKKYRFLYICYNIFMTGLVVSMLAFVIAMLTTY